MADPETDPVEAFWQDKLRSLRPDCRFVKPGDSANPTLDWHCVVGPEGFSVGHDFEQAAMWFLHFYMDNAEAFEALRER